jgi:putative transposase
MGHVGQHHRPGASACGRKKRGPSGEGLGRSRGGFSTKLHAKVDALGNPIKLTVTAGQVNDITQAETLIEGQKKVDKVIADKAYDSDKLIEKIKEQGGEAVIPPKANRKHQREYDKHLDKERNLAERFMNRLKQNRRVATRYEKTARNYLAFAHLASIFILLR